MLEGYPFPCSGGGGLSSLNVLRAHLDTTSVSLKKKIEKITPQNSPQWHHRHNNNRPYKIMQHISFVLSFLVSFILAI